MHEKDIEAGSGFDSGNGKAPLEAVTDKTYVDTRHGSIVDEVARSRNIQSSFAPFRVMRQGEDWLDAKMGIETQGIDRIPEEDKRPPSILNSFFIWFSMTCHVGTLPIGILGPVLGLSLGQSVAAIVVGTFLGALCTAFCGTLGPKAREFPVLEPLLVRERPDSQPFADLLSSSSACVPSLRPDIRSVSMAPNCAPFLTLLSAVVSLSSMSWLAVRSSPLSPTIA